jgi:L-cysteine desulfidase
MLLLILFMAAAALLFVAFDNSLISSRSALSNSGSQSKGITPISTLPIAGYDDKEILSKETEYRVTTDPDMRDVYCANYYGAGTLMYAYIGQTDASKPTLRCD